MKYPYGNRLDTISFMWKVPEEGDETKNARMVLQVTKEIAKYSTWENFIEKYRCFATVSKGTCILQCIYHDFTEDSSSAPTVAQYLRS